MNQKNNKSESQQNIEKFMGLAGQEVLKEPAIPDEQTRLLRAKLILEEAIETVNALGIKVWTNIGYLPESMEFDLSQEGPDLKEIADGCADIHVVTTGTLSACGISDLPLYKEVDKNNLDKFGEGHSFRDDGKLIKPPNHQPPNIEKVLNEQKKRTE